MTLICECPFCGERNVIELTPAEEANYVLWQQRKLLMQEAFPKRSVDEREMIKTGICERCWNNMFEGFE